MASKKDKVKPVSKKVRLAKALARIGDLAVIQALSILLEDSDMEAKPKPETDEEKEKE